MHKPSRTSRNAVRRSLHRSARARSLKSADWAFHAADHEVLDALARGRHAASLREYFGAPAYAELCLLAAAAKKAAKPRGPRVLVLPGIMGSKLSGRLPVATGAASRHRAGTKGAASPRSAPATLWIDPLQIAAGHFTALARPGKAVKPAGVLLFSYARLRLQLQIAGCDVDFHSYDWRLGLPELGASLAARIRREGRPLILVAHSMGALVARMAMRLLPKRAVRRLIMVGAPNQGSFAPVQALRGTYPFVRRIATLDRKHTAEYLTKNVFRTFPGLYHMLPLARHTQACAPRAARIDLFDRRCWPTQGPTPDAALLADAAGARAALAPVDSRMTHIIGVNQQTVVGVRRTGRGFEYTMDRNGDGTVPLVLAKSPGLKCHFVDEAHGNLPNNPRVIQAILELVRRGRTISLPQRWRARPGIRRYTDDARLRMDGARKIDWRRLNAAQREAVFAELDSGRLLPEAAHPLA